MKKFVTVSHVFSPCPSSMWDLWWTEWHGVRHFSEYFSFSCQPSCQRFIHVLHSEWREAPGRTE